MLFNDCIEQQDDNTAFAHNDYHINRLSARSSHHSGTTSLLAVHQHIGQKCFHSVKVPHSDAAYHLYNSAVNDNTGQHAVALALGANANATLLDHMSGRW